jgi:non-homologous end joining protein Ku
MSQKHNNTTLAILKENQKESQKRGASGVSRKPRSRLLDLRRYECMLCILLVSFPYNIRTPDSLTCWGVTDWTVGCG